jgi:hypothetical protein
MPPGQMPMGQQPMGQQPMGQQPMPGQMPMGQQPMPGQMPMGQQPMMPGQMPMGQPMVQGPLMPMGANAQIGATAKRSMRFTIFMVAVTTIPIMAIMLYTFVDFSSLTGDGPEGGYCEAAAKCCKIVSGGVADSACENFDQGGMPVEGCKMALEQYKKSAERMDKECD